MPIERKINMTHFGTCTTYGDPMDNIIGRSQHVQSTFTNSRIIFFPMRKQVNTYNRNIYFDG